MTDLCTQSFFHSPWAGRELDVDVGRMIGLEGLSQKLSREQLEMLLHRQHFGFLVQVVDGRCGVATCDQAEGFVLDQLEATD